MKKKKSPDDLRLDAKEIEGPDEFARRKLREIDGPDEVGVVEDSFSKHEPEGALGFEEDGDGSGVF